ncbi:Scr1 family TA system antitoxin-like transcriptional regulator [Actinosynnema sp. NPDC023587]|uniref:Scr1 family TA system antitoxin-like transcriptional regulator n=1 Tax=Actinosynnema sp. NPDC023587 TaxID=3154695 RepID=UPI0033C30F00
MFPEPDARTRDRPGLITWTTAWEDAGPALDLLCRAAERIDILSPTGVPALTGLDPARCTAYVSEGTTADRSDVTVRVIPWRVGLYPGIGRVVTLFRLPGGRAVVHYPCPHGAVFTEDPAECRAAREVFDRLPAYAAERSLKRPAGGERSGPG